MERKQKKQVITIEKKQEIIHKFLAGTTAAEIARNYNLKRSTVSSIIAKKETILKARVAKGVSRIHNPQQRHPLINDMEEILLMWIEKKKQSKTLINKTIICEKAMHTMDDLKRIKGCEIAFTASNGWFNRFRLRSKVHLVNCHGEAASGDIEGARQFSTEFREMIAREGYSLDQLFNADETGLLWKKLPNRTYLPEGEKRMPGRKPEKDRVTLMFCANASGECRIKPLLIYKSENPRVFKSKGVVKSRLPVQWASQKSAWMSKSLFKNWVTQTFAPSVQQYLMDKNLPIKALLLLDNAAVHSPEIKAEIEAECDFIKVMFLPPNTTALIQPMDQQVISNFKKLYIRALYKKYFEISEYSSQSCDLREFYKLHFDIVDAIRIIGESWDGVTQRTLKAAWRNLLDVRDEPESVDDIVRDIISIAHRADVPITENDIESWHDVADLISTEDWLGISNGDSNENDGDELAETSTEDLENWLRKWEEIEDDTQRLFPNVVDVRDASNAFNNAVAERVRSILNTRRMNFNLNLSSTQSTFAESSTQLSAANSEALELSFEDNHINDQQINMSYDESLDTLQSSGSSSQMLNFEDNDD